jgi:ATP-binding cassette subfamily B protein
MAVSCSQQFSKFVRRARDVPRACRIAWDAAPIWTAASAAVLTVQGLLPLATVWLSRSLVDAIVAAIHEHIGWRTAHTAIMSAFLIAVVAITQEILRSLGGWIRTNQGELVRNYVLDLVHRKSVEVDLAFYDSAEFFDRLHRARPEAYYRPLALIESVGSLGQNAITLVSMFVLLFSFGPWMPLVLAVGSAPALWVVLRYAVQQHEMRLSTTEQDRRTWYYDWLLTSRESAAELRLFDLGNHFRTAFNLLRGQLRRKQSDLAKDNALAELLAGTLALIVTGASLAWMLSRALSGLLSLGNLMLFYQVMEQGLRVVRSVLDNVGQLYYNSLFVSNLFEFLALQPSLLSPGIPRDVPDRLHIGITFENVTFHYPGAVRPALRNFSLHIPAGYMVAFVGPNGSGRVHW